MEEYEALKWIDKCPRFSWCDVPTKSSDQKGGSK